MKAIPWEMFLIWDKNTTKSLQNSIVYLRAPESVATGMQKTIVADTSHVNTQSVNVSVSVCVSVHLWSIKSL